jgi:hypothetical protein
MPVSAPIRASAAKQLAGQERRMGLAACWAAALTSAALLNLAYFPVGQGWLAWFALAPWLLLVRANIRERDRYLIAWLAAWAFFLPAMR